MRLLYFHTKQVRTSFDIFKEGCIIFLEVIQNKKKREEKIVQDKKNSKKHPCFSDLYDIIGGSDTAEEERQLAWEQLLPIENNTGFAIIIAAKYSWREYPKEYKEKAWQELLKRDVKNDENSLHYLAVNALEPWCKSARDLEKKLER